MWNGLQFETMESVLAFLLIQMYSCLVATLFAIFLFWKHLHTLVRLDAQLSTTILMINTEEMKILGVLAIVQVMCFRSKIKFLGVMDAQTQKKGCTGHLNLLSLEVPFSASWIRGLLHTGDDQR